MRVVLILLLFPFLLSASPPKDVTIVIPKNGGQEFLRLSLKLAEAMKKSTGGTVNVTTQLQDDHVIPVWLATLEKPATGYPTEGLDTLGEDGYILQCDGKSFLIAAKTGQGLSNGCNAFLERICGVRMYAPGMTVIPGGVALSLKPFHVVE